MLFYDPLFLFVFAPAVYLVYLFLGDRAVRRGLILALASIAFYVWCEPVFIILVFASLALDLLVGARIHALAHDARARRDWLTLGVLANLAILIWFKYAGFIVFNIDVLARALTLPGLYFAQVALPVGVSFIVFEKITYLVDVYRGAAAPARPLLYVLYVFFFPKLLAGPIVKYHDIARQLEEAPHASMDDFIEGFSRFMLGVVKKLLLADTLASGADLVFSRDAATLGFADAWAGVFLFTLQIYFDFSGYSDMAIGLARIFGFRLFENFNMPYVATSITEFWRRWHMSLTGWIREYLYFPLGGNRCGAARAYANLWLCFLASGLWHGAAWTYVLWGAYNGVFLVLDRLFLLERLKRLPDWLANLLTLLVVMAGWALFRAASLAQAVALLSSMAQPLAPSSFIFGPEHALSALIGVAIVFAQRIGVSRNVNWRQLAERHAFASNSALSLLFIAALTKGLAEPFKPFIYFRF